MRLISVFARLLPILLGFLFGIVVLWLMFHHSQYLWTAPTIIYFLILPSIYISLVLFALAHGKGAMINLTLVTISCAIPLYLAEFLLVLSGPYITLQNSFDRRSKLQVVQDLRQSGENAFPSVHPKNIMPGFLTVSGAEVLPLSGISRVPTVFCNETGKYYIYDSDEFGFANPLGLYSQPVDVALIGDSFTQGFCAPSGQSYAEQVRATIPRTLNLGQNGNGPLLELATIREYLSNIKPRYVFWFYFEGNDIPDLSREITHPVLSRYLKDPQFSGHAVAKAKDYDQALREFVETGVATEQSRSTTSQMIDDFPGQFRLWSQLWHIRALLGLTDIKREWALRHWNSEVSEDEVFLKFNHILEEAKSRVEGWGGQFIFVYLPSYRTFGYDVEHPWRERILEQLKRSKIQTIDLLSIFKRNPDPVSLFNFRKEAHYTPEGNMIVAQNVLNFVLNFVPNKNSVKVPAFKARQARFFSRHPSYLHRNDLHARKKLKRLYAQK